MPKKSESIGEYLKNSFYTPGQPKVIIWFKLYCLIILFFTLIQILLGFVYAMTHNGEIAFVLFLTAIPILGLYMPSLLLPRMEWVWIYNLTILGISLTSCIFIPFAVPIIYFWLKPEVKNFYKR